MNGDEAPRKRLKNYLFFLQDISRSKLQVFRDKKLLTA
jgi:hypothetical protein